MAGTMDVRNPPKFDDLSEDLRAQIKPELAAGERRLWAGRSGNRPAGAEATPMFALFTGDVGLVGVACLAAFAEPSEARAERRRIRGELYALTDRRAIIWRPPPRSGAVEVFSLPRGTLKGVPSREYPDGSGDVIIGRVEANPRTDPGPRSVASPT